MSAPQPLDQAARTRVTIAAMRAVRRYPGPAGTILARELLAWAAFGYRLGTDGAVMRLVDDLAGAGAAQATPRGGLVVTAVAPALTSLAAELDTVVRSPGDVPDRGSARSSTTTSRGAW